MGSHTLQWVRLFVHLFARFPRWSSWKQRRLTSETPVSHNGLINSQDVQFDSNQINKQHLMPNQRRSSVIALSTTARLPAGNLMTVSADVFTLLRVTSGSWTSFCGTAERSVLCWVILYLLRHILFQNSKLFLVIRRLQYQYQYICYRYRPI